MSEKYKSKYSSGPEMSSAARARARLKKKKERERRRKFTIFAVSATSLLLIGIVLVFALSGNIFKKAPTGIYPGIYVAGTDLSGMSEIEAIQAIETHAESYFKQSKITVSYESDFLDIFASDVGMKVDAEAAAKIAYAYGRDTADKDTEVGYTVNGKNIEITSAYSLDEELLDEKIEQFVALVKGKISVCGYELTDTAVVIDLSSGGKVLDKTSMKNDIEEMLLSCKFGTYEPTPVNMTPDSLDVDELYTSVFTEPQDAQLKYVPIDWDENSTEPFDPEGYTGKLKYIVQKEQNGLSFDINAAKLQLSTAGNKTRFEFPLIVTPPSVTSDTVSASIYRDVLSSYKTKLTSDRNRTENIRLASVQVNGTELMPGEVFSYNKVVGQRTEAKGYKKAAIFVKGEVVDDIGGGICQLSSTIYITTLLTDLEQVSRAPHRYAVTYTPLGQDATVAWGSIDYQFRNSLDYPIKIETYLRDGMVHVILYGTKTNDYKYELISTQDDKMEYKESEKYVSLNSEDATAHELTAIGQKKTTGGKYGYKSTTYLITKDRSGNEIARKKVNNSTYRTQDKITYIAAVLDANGQPYLDEKGKPYDPTVVPPVETGTEPSTDRPPEPSTGDSTEPSTGTLPEPDPGPDAGNPNP